MKKIILHIDTSDNRETEVALEINGKISKISRKHMGWTSQLLLPLTDRLLKQNKINPAELSEIRVNCGPGSFTGVRVGVTVANIIGWYLSVPVNNQKLPALPRYDI